MSETLRILLERQQTLEAELRAVQAAIQAIRGTDSGFSERVVQLMRQKGVSGRELSLRIGRSPSYMQTIINGVTEIPSLTTLRALSDALGEDLLPYIGAPGQLGSRLRTARKTAKMTLTEASAQLGVTNQAVSQWETGATKPSSQNLLRAVKLYGADLRSFQG